MFSKPGRIPAPGRPRAILFDALGTLVSLQPPAPLLRAGVRARLGVEVDDVAAERVMCDEIAYYRAHLDEAADGDGLTDLRRRCAALVRDGLELDASVDQVVPILLGALRFEPFPDAPPALRELRAAGLALVVVSNWDVSLHEVLARTTLRPLVDAAVSSAEAGSAKPDGAIFERALALASCRASEAWHVGDSPEADVEGAQKAGITPVLIDRAGAPGWGPVRRISSLAELVALM